MLALPFNEQQLLREKFSQALYEFTRKEFLKCAANAELSPTLAGRLYFSDTGWLLLSVPNAVVRGLFDALDEPGISLPVKKDGKLNAHITVMRPEEIEQAGGQDKITERGHTYRYNIGAMKCVKPTSWDNIAKVWYVTVNSPELQELRRSYGLSSLPKEGKHDFHITVAVRKTKVLQTNEVSKA